MCRMRVLMGRCVCVCVCVCVVGGGTHLIPLPHMLDLFMASLIQTPGLCVCGVGGGGGTFNTFTTHAGLAHDITDTES